MLLGKTWFRLEGTRIGNLPPQTVRLVIKVLRRRKCLGCGKDWYDTGMKFVRLTKPIIWCCPGCPLDSDE